MLTFEHIVTQINKILNVSEAITYSEKNDISHYREFGLLLRDAGKTWSTDLYSRIFEEYSLIKKNSINDKMYILFGELESNTSSAQNNDLSIIVNDTKALWKSYFLGFDELEEILHKDQKALLRKISSLLDVVESA
jgi:hypothetical protein